MRLRWAERRLFVRVLAAYAANHANRYQHRERGNRKLELELRALGPFLEPVDKAERERFRLRIAEVFFAQDDRLNEKPGPTTPLAFSRESLDKILDIAKNGDPKAAKQVELPAGSGNSQRRDVPLAVAGSRRRESSSII